MQNSTVSADSQPELGHVVSDQHRLSCFKCGSSSLPGLVCSFFFEASSRNGGGFCQGYSLAIV